MYRFVMILNKYNYTPDFQQLQLYTKISYSG